MIVVVILGGVIVGSALWFGWPQPQRGLHAHYYTNADWQGTPALVKIEPGPQIANQEERALPGTEIFSAKWTGWITLPEAGVYQFATISDGSSHVWINGQEVVSNDGDRGLNSVSGEITLEAGVYPFELRYVQRGRKSVLQTHWHPPQTFDQELLPSEVLLVKAPGRIRTWLKTTGLLLTSVFARHSKPSATRPDGTDSPELAAFSTSPTHLIRTFRDQVVEITTHIDLRQRTSSTRYIGPGWRRIRGEKGIRATRTNSSLFFDHYDVTHDLEAAITCQFVSAEANPPGMLQVVVNGHPIGHFSAPPAEWDTYRITIPAANLRSGRNILELQQITPQAAQPSEDTPLLVKAIDLQTRSHLRYVKDTGIMQRTDSGFDVFVTLPQQFLLEVAYQNVGGAHATLEIFDEAGSTLRFELPERETNYRNTITLAAAGVHKLRFVSAGPANRYTVWQQVNVYPKETQTAVFQPEQGFTKAAKPDIVLYVVDTLRADHLSAYGYHRKTSPQFDRFAQEHTLFRNAYSATSWTRSSAAAILTGLSPRNNKTRTLEDKLPEELVTLAEALQEQGYYTVALVTNVNLSQSLGFGQGFMEHRELLRGHDTRTMQSDEVHEYILEFFQDYLDTPDRRPFFMLVWTMDPHTPYTPAESVSTLFHIEQYTPTGNFDEEFLQQLWRGEIHLTPSQIEYAKTRYDQEIYFNDQSFGQLLQAMRQFGIYDDSVIIFTADHGEEFFEHGGVTHGRTLYNEQIRVPLAIKANQMARGVRDERVQSIDLYPTILAVTGIKEPYRLDGLSLLQTISPDRVLYFDNEFGNNDLTARLDDVRKTIFNQVTYRPPFDAPVPVVESYAAEDNAEHTPLALTGFADALRLQDIFSYRDRQPELELTHTPAEMTPEMQEQLRDLGYVK